MEERTQLSDTETLWNSRGTVKQQVLFHSYNSNDKSSWTSKLGYIYIYIHIEGFRRRDPYLDVGLLARWSHWEMPSRK